MADEVPKPPYKPPTRLDVDPKVQAFIDEIRQRVAATSGVRKNPLGNLRVKLPRIRRKVQHMVPVAINFAFNNPRVMPYGTKEQELRDSLQNLTNLVSLLTALRSIVSIVKDSVHQLETDLWKVALHIYDLAQAHEKTDPDAAQFAKEMRAKMKLGPRHQTYVMAPIAPTNLSKKAVKKAQLAKAKKEAGIPSLPE